jgi:hypothetical protein
MKTDRATSDFSAKRAKPRYIMINEDIFETLSPDGLKVYMTLRYEADYGQDSSAVKRNIKFICNTSKVKRTSCFDALLELEKHGLLKRESDPGYQSIYWVAQDLNYYSDKEAIESPIPPVQPADYPVQPADYPVQPADTITSNLFTNPDHLRPYGDSANTPVVAKDYKDDELFMSFYNNYPRKEKPHIAYKAFIKLNPNEDFVQMLILDLMMRKENNWKGRTKDKIPHPSSYLNAREWEGDIIKHEVDPNKKTPRRPFNKMVNKEVIS